MTEEDIHILPPSEETTKQPVDNYSLLFPKFFFPHIEDRDGGKMITWSLKNGRVHGWVFLETPKKGWKNKPIMPINQYTITHSNLDKIHEFMEHVIRYDENSHTKIRQFFISESLRLLKDGGSS